MFYGPSVRRSAGQVYRSPSFPDRQCDCKRFGRSTKTRPCLSGVRRSRFTPVACIHARLAETRLRPRRIKGTSRLRLEQKNPWRIAIKLDSFFVMRSVGAVVVGAALVGPFWAAVRSDASPTPAPSRSAASPSPVPSKSSVPPVFVGPAGWYHAQGKSDGLGTWLRSGNVNNSESIVVQAKDGIFIARCLVPCRSRLHRGPSRPVRLRTHEDDGLRQPPGVVHVLHVHVVERRSGYRGTRHRRLRNDGVFRALQQVDFRRSQRRGGTIAYDAVLAHGVALKRTLSATPSDTSRSRRPTVCGHRRRPSGGGDPRTSSPLWRSGAGAREARALAARSRACPSPTVGDRAVTGLPDCRRRDRARHQRRRRKRVAPQRR